MSEKELLEGKNEDKGRRMSSKKENAVLEQLWLTYYNDTLFAKGVITEKERNKMRVRIKNRTYEMDR